MSAALFLPSKLALSRLNRVPICFPLLLISLLSLLVAADGVMVWGLLLRLQVGVT